MTFLLFLLLAGSFIYIIKLERQRKALLGSLGPLILAARHDSSDSIEDVVDQFYENIRYIDVKDEKLVHDMMSARGAISRHNQARMLREQIDLIQSLKRTAD